MDLYAYHFMIHLNAFNHLHKYQQLFHDYAVDIYAEIESERLGYIRGNQKQPRSEDYAHLKDAINNDIARR